MGMKAVHSILLYIIQLLSLKEIDRPCVLPAGGVRHMIS